MRDPAAIVLHARRVIGRHLGRGGRVALAFSGGRDSLATLFILREFWGQLTVYHCDTGDAFPEVSAIVDEVRRSAPNFVVVPGSVQDVWLAHGWPSDLVPTKCTPLGRSRYGTDTPKVLDRMSCCYLTYMKPTFDRMVLDGSTLIIRGSRDDENAAPMTNSGTVIGGQEFLYPIASWSAAEVTEYLSGIGVQPATFYTNGLPTTLDCMHCTGWWEYRQGAYLKKHHPDQHKEYVRRITLIKTAISEQMADCEV